MTALMQYTKEMPQELSGTCFGSPIKNGHGIIKVGGANRVTWADFPQVHVHVRASARSTLALLLRLRRTSCASARQHTIQMQLL